MKRGVLLTLLLVVWPATSFATWVDPTCDPATDPTTCNILPPLNVSSVTQAKDGTLQLNGNEVSDTFTFSGLAANFSITANSIDDAEVSDTLTASKFVGPGSASPVVDLDTLEVNGTLPSGSVTDVWVNTTGDTMTGTLDIEIPSSSSDKGINILSQSTTSSAIALSVMTTDAVAKAVSVVNTATSGYGVYSLALGTSGIGVYGNGFSTGGTGVYGTGEAYGVKGTSTDGNAGYFSTTGNQSTTVYVSNTGTPSETPSYGVDISTVGAIGIRAQSDSGTAGYFKSTTGAAGEFESSNNIAGKFTATSGTAGYFKSTSGTAGNFISTSGTGVNVDVGDFGKAIEANEGDIHNAGSFTGGQFYPNALAGNGAFPNVALEVFSSKDVSVYHPFQIVYDGNQVFLATYHDTATGTFQIYDQSTGAQIRSYDHDLVASIAGMTTYGKYVYVFDSGSDSFFRYNRLSGVTVSGGTTGATTYPTTVASDGEVMWIGTATTLQTWTGSGTPTTRVSSLNSITDIITTDKYIYASSSSAGVIYKVLRASPYTKSTITTGGLPVGKMVYDGQYIWVADNGAGLIRINTANSSLTTYSVSSGGYYPKTLAFDGVNLWIGFNGPLIGKYNIASGTIVDTETLTYGGSGPLISSILFDGTYIWAGVSSSTGGYLYQLPAGTGHGTSTTTIRRGLMMYNVDGNPYCVYLNSSGALTTSATTTNCL